ncbi:MAG: MBL fold metallo-hydrolase [Candidatus Omnitrophica bacterium]|nr:MBL fold metallo-hydrolase [Candidatus Omnitrophota bacterium]
MNVKILFNSTSNNDHLSVGWGLAFLIGKHILFDTGEKGSFLKNNIKTLKIDFSLVNYVVISHDHWDHTGGLGDILKMTTDINVYSCPGFSTDFKQNVKSGKASLIENRTFTKIVENVYTTGEILGEYNGEQIAEQALVIETERGLSVITGCAHPGIIKILRTVKKNFNGKQLYSVLGGFHLLNTDPPHIQGILDEFKKMGVKKVGPTHCSGSEAENMFRSHYKNDFLNMKVGENIII